MDGSLRIFVSIGNISWVLHISGKKNKTCVSNLTYRSSQGINEI